MRIGVLIICTALWVRCQSPRAELFDEGRESGLLARPLSEVSGLVASRKNEGLLWAHNDSRNPAELFLIDREGKIRCTFSFPALVNRDWEDIAIGPGPQPGETYLYIGDIGDNESRYEYKYIYLLAEPGLPDSDKAILRAWDTLVVKLPDEVLDTEALAVQPRTGDLYIFSKRLRVNFAYVIRQEQMRTGDTLTFAKISEIPYFNIVAADFSSDGSELLIKTYDKVLYWKLDLPDLGEALRRPATLLPYDPEPQGETIAWALDGTGFYTVSESRNNGPAPVLFYRRRER